MTVKVKNGTPVYGPSLCETCERALIVKGYRESEQVVVCQAAWPEMQLKFPVRECSRYASQGGSTCVTWRKSRGLWYREGRSGRRALSHLAATMGKQGRSISYRKRASNTAMSGENVRVHHDCENDFGSGDGDLDRGRNRPLVILFRGVGFQFA
jgi:hypothetical protein